MADLKSPRILAFTLAGIVFLVDRLTKWWIEAAVSPWESLVVIPGFFQIIHTRNPGAAFSLLADASREVRLFVLVGVSLAVLALISTLLWNASHHLSSGHRILRTGLSLVLGGALGNVYDRVMSGAVTDFLDFHIAGYHWPTFNVADSAITIGASLMLLSMWRGRQEAVRT